MQTVKTGKEKQIVYAYEYRRLSKALSEEFYIEAVSIDYAVIEDRLVAFLHHAGIVSRTNDKLSINGSVSLFIHKILDKQMTEPIRIKNISVKMDVIEELLHLSEEKAIEIDNEIKEMTNSKGKRLAQNGYMAALQKKISHTLDKNAVEEILSKLDPWRNERNQLIHGLLNKTVYSSIEAQKACAEQGQGLSRMLDDKLVKPFKKNSRIRKRFNIQ